MFLLIYLLVPQLHLNIYHQFIRKIGDGDDPFVILHYFMLVSAVCSDLAMIPYWVTPGIKDCLWVLLTGSVGFAAQLYFTSAIQQPGSEVSFFAIIRYGDVLYALIIGYIFFGKIYNLQSFTGIFLIFTGLILSFRLKSRFKKVEMAEE